MEHKETDTRPRLVPLDKESRATLTTSEAARHLNRAEQTLRIWACKENGPVRPVRVHGRLAWPVADIKRAPGLAAQALTIRKCKKPAG